MKQPMRSRALRRNWISFTVMQLLFHTDPLYQKDRTGMRFATSTIDIQPFMLRPPRIAELYISPDRIATLSPLFFDRAGVPSNGGLRPRGRCGIYL